MIFNTSKNYNKMGLDHHEDICDTGLGLGLSTYEGKIDQNGLLKADEDHKKPSFKFDHHQHQFTTSTSTSLEQISLTLGFSDVIAEKIDMNINKDRQASYSPNSDLSNSFSNTTKSVKREKELVGSHDEMEVEKVSSRVISDEDDEGSARKKLRLTKEQSVLLEESFKEHSTLNPKQKQALAKQLNLRHRQVEVWFQNRRARTKLKQTEVDCEFLKKCCETLTEENRRLHKELQELKALKLASVPPQMYMQLPAATLTICPSCERLGGYGGGGGSGGGGADDSSKNPSTVTPKPHFYNPLLPSIIHPQLVRDQIGR